MPRRPLAWRPIGGRLAVEGPVYEAKNKLGALLELDKAIKVQPDARPLSRPFLIESKTQACRGRDGDINQHWSEPDNPDALVLRGELRGERGQLEDAVKDFEAAGKSIADMVEVILDWA